MLLTELQDKYKSAGGGYFSLKNNNDNATVRFLYDVTDASKLEGKDLDAYVVHQVEIGGKRRYVKCLETGDCPLCKSGNKPQLKIFLQLFDYEDEKVKIWERGASFISTMIGLINNYGALSERKIKVERHGVKGDTGTTYQMYALDKDGGKLADFDKQELLGKFIFTKTKEEMVSFLNGETPAKTEPRTQQGNADVF